MTSLQGGCLCGAIRFACHAAPVSVVCCHCTDCRRAHAAPYAACALMPAGSVEILSGAPRRYARPGDSGAIVVREFCGDCGTHLFSGSAAFAQWKTVKIAALDDPAAIAPVAHVYIGSRIPWACIDDGVPSYAREISVADLERLGAKGSTATTQQVTAPPAADPPRRR